MSIRCYHKIFSGLWEVILAIGTGVIGSFSYDFIITNRRKSMNTELYSYLDSNGKYDWICHNLNGIEIGEDNGSRAKIKFETDNELTYEWKEKNGDEGSGKMKILDSTYGKLTYHYKNDNHFSGFKSFFIGQKVINRKPHDYIYSMTDPHRGLNTEILIREKFSHS